MSTTERIGRNDPCPCGSGRKYKACCEGRAGPVAQARRSPRMVVGLSAAVLAVAGGVFIALREEEPAATSLATPSPLPGPASGAPGGTGTITPQPAGPAPAGKVWSPEHGHYHDAPAAAGAIPTLTPDASGVIDFQPQPGSPAVFTPQPPDPIPEGKVWSPEHGHWHDAPAAGTPVPK